MINHKSIADLALILVVTEERIAQISKLNSHLQALVSQKDKIISRLQKPYVGDFLRVEAPYKR